VVVVVVVVVVVKVVVVVVVVVVVIQIIRRQRFCGAVISTVRYSLTALIRKTLFLDA